MNFKRHLDWLGVTLPEGKQPEDILPFCNFKWIGKGLHGYKNRLQDSVYGAVAQTDAHDKRMGVHIQLSGDTLRAIRTDNVASEDGLFTSIRAHDGRCSRVDCAIDIHGSTLSVGQLEADLLSGAAFVKAKKISRHTSKTGNFLGDTLYIGGRQSDRMMRVYDKNAEQKIVDTEAWLRLEIEIKGVLAHMFGKATETNTVDSMIVGHFRDMLVWQQSDFSDCLFGNNAELEKPGKKLTDTEKWLIEICAPSLARASSVNDQLMSQFMDAYFEARKAFE